MSTSHSATGLIDRFSSEGTLYDPLVSSPSTSTSDFHDDQNGYSASSWNEQARIWIPSEHTGRSRTLVLCFDGTGDQFDSDNSNVVQLVSMLKKDDTTKQLIYYQTGIGTYTDPVLKTPVLTGVSEVLDEMLAWNLHSHIKAGYSFLMQNYTSGDKICIFGFSRGAYTARALAGMLQKIGLLPPHNNQQIPFAYNMYLREDPEGLDLSDTFKRTFCRDISVDFLGVWDTVASVGVVPHYLPFVTENTGIKYLRHALALDERRIKFLPSYCVDTKREAAFKKAKAGGKGKHVERQESEPKLYQDEVNGRTTHPTDVLEVWFAGVHTDVGGGSVKNDTPHALARIPLRWMIRECFKCGTGIIFDAVMLQHIGLNVHLDKTGAAVLGEQPERLMAQPPPEGPLPTKSSSLWGVLKGIWGLLTYPVKFLLSFFVHPVTQQTKQNIRRLPASPYTLNLLSPEEGARHEAEAELKDAMSPLYDQLVANWVWHILEWVPMRVKKQKAIVGGVDGRGAYKWVPRSEDLQDEMDEGMKVHRSVKTRLEAGAAFEEDEPIYVPKVRPHIPSPKTSDANGKGKTKSKSKEPVRLQHAEWNLDEPVHWKWVH